MTILRPNIAHWGQNDKLEHDTDDASKPDDKQHPKEQIRSLIWTRDPYEFGTRVQVHNQNIVRSWLEAWAPFFPWLR